MKTTDKLIKITETGAPAYLFIPEGEAGSRQDVDEARRKAVEVELPRRALTLLLLLRDQVATSDQQFEQMVRAIGGRRSPVASEAPLKQARRNAEARWEFLESYHGLTSSEVADLAGSTAKNRSATAHNWQARLAIFPVEYQGDVYFPAFQFSDDGKPKRIIGDVLPLLRHAGMRGWEIAFWFTSQNGWLGGARPVDVMDAEPAQVQNAAERAADVIS